MTTAVLTPECKKITYEIANECVALYKDICEVKFGCIQCCKATLIGQKILRLARQLKQNYCGG